MDIKIQFGPFFLQPREHSSTKATSWRMQYKPSFNKIRFSKSKSECSKNK